MYNDERLYTTHELGLPHPVPVFQPNELTFGKLPKQPSHGDYNQPYHYYVPEGWTPPDRRVYVDYYNPKLASDQPPHKQVVEPYHQDWPSPFINFFFPNVRFDPDYLNYEGLIAITISIVDAPTNWITKQMHDKIGLNFVDSKGKTHRIFGLYCEDGQLISRCFSCGVLADNCLCDIWEKEGKIWVDDVPDLVNCRYQLNYGFPRIKGVSCDLDYSILVLDKTFLKKKKEQKELGQHGETPISISENLCRRSEETQGAESSDLLNIPSVQTSTKTSELNQPTIPIFLNIQSVEPYENGNQRANRNGFPGRLGLRRDYSFGSHAKKKTKIFGKIDFTSDGHCSTESGKVTQRRTAKQRRQARKSERKQRKKEKRQKYREWKKKIQEQKKELQKHAAFYQREQLRLFELSHGPAIYTTWQTSNTTINGAKPYVWSKTRKKTVRSTEHELQQRSIQAEPASTDVSW